MSARLLSLFVRYGTGSHGRREGLVSTIADLHRHHRLCSIPRHPVIVIDNARPAGDGPVDEELHQVVPGDNSRSEFSAWDRGLAFARAQGLEYDAVCFTTSTFQSGWSTYTRFVDARVLELVARTPCAVGHFDAYNEPVELFGRRSQHWIRTAYFVMSRSVIDTLGSLVSIAAPEQIFSDDGEELFRSDAPLGEPYREHLLRWLLGHDLGQGQIWHSAVRDVRDDLREVRRKVLAILDEHMLAVRLREAGVRTLDAIWLGHNFKRVVAPLVLGGWRPDWRQQLRERPVGGLALHRGTALHFESRLDARDRS